MLTAKHVLTSESATRTHDIPTLAQLIKDGQESDRRIKRATKEALEEWLNQSERLHIAKTHYSLRGDRFVHFAKQIGIDRSTAFELIKLHKHRAAVMARCLDAAEAAAKLGESFTYPGWRSALAWFEGSAADQQHAQPRPTGSSHRAPVTWKHESDEWATPQGLFDLLNRTFQFDVDMAATAQNAKCKQFWTKADDGPKQVWKAGKSHWVNPPYSQAGKWVKKAHDAARSGAIVVMLLANRTATGWYRDYVASSAMVVQLYGRVKFNHQTINASSAPFASMLCIWPRSAGDRIRHLGQPVDTVLMAFPADPDVGQVGGQVSEETLP